MMLHKVIGKTEKSKAKGPTGAINYLSGYSWRNTQPQVLRGNLEVTRELLAHEDKDPYTHGVLSYEENALDVPQSEQDFAMNLIEETLMAGFPPEHYDIVWIRHDDKDFDPKRGSGRLELNYHIVNRDLVTGKKISPYVHQFDMHRVNLAKQIINDRFGYTSPDDPARARQINVMNYGSDNKGKAKELTDFILNGIQKEQIDSRDDIIKALQSRDDVEHVEPNKTDTFLVLKMKGAKRNLRLKGTLYGKQFTSVERLLAATQDDSRQYHRASKQRLASNIEELQQLNARRAEKRQRIIEPKRKRGRKPNAIEPICVKTNPEQGQPLNCGNDKPSNKLNRDFDERNQQSQKIKPADIRRDAASTGDSGEISRQVLAGNLDYSSTMLNSRDRDWNSYSVLIHEIPKLKIKLNYEQKHKNNTNLTNQATLGIRAAIETRPSTNRRDIEQEHHRFGIDLGSIQRAAINIRELATRIAESIRSNISAVFSINSGATSERGVTKDYEQLNTKCDKLDRLLREKTRITLVLDIANEVKAEQSKSTLQSRLRM